MLTSDSSAGSFRYQGRYVDHYTQSDLPSLKEKADKLEKEINSPISKEPILYFSFVFLALIAYLLLTIFHVKYDLGLYIATILASGIFGMYYAYAFWMVKNRRLKEIHSKYKVAILELESETPTANMSGQQGDVFINKVWETNLKYIDKYYLQTQEQADKSFKLSRVTASVGFIIVISGIVLMYFNKVNSAYIATASGVISEFISAVFFYLYNRTIQKMSGYHQKLVLTQNISLALKMAEQMPLPEKTLALQNLIEKLTTDINKYLVEKQE